MDAERYFHGLWTMQPLDALAEFAAVYGLYVVCAIAAFAWLRRRPKGALAPIVVGAVVAAAIVWIAGAVYQEQRPFVVLGVTPLVPHDADNAFPSDHSAAAAYAATIAFFIDPALGAGAWIAAAAVGVGRAYCLLHSPDDVVAGWLIGALPAVAAGAYWKKRRAA
jgi:undecaprenyl-diphosphatase